LSSIESVHRSFYPILSLGRIAMEITGRFSELSCNEIFQFVDRTRLTGCLTIAAPDSKSPKQYVWFDNGDIVGTAPQSRSNPLLWLIHQQDWMGYAASSRLASKCPESQTLGSYLKAQGVLKSDQLRHLFQVQLKQMRNRLSDLDDATFHLESGATLPHQQMTGLRIPAQDVTIQKRVLAIA
jgi:hypothetical protein